ncbi:MAG: MFS transporter [Caldisphaeraceae archaeon]|nr:MFS transporter [Caldisphaeraceae archaeon]
MLREELLIYATKTTRVFSSGLLSILTPIYLARLGYGSIVVGISVLLMIMGSVASNLILVKYGSKIKVKRLLMSLSLITILSGLILVSTSYLVAIFLALFIGNSISSTGTEAGPYQSSENALLSKISMDKQKTYAIYNFLGYGASSLGALSSSGLSHASVIVMRHMYFVLIISGTLMFIIYSRLQFPTMPKKKAFSSEFYRSNALRLSALFSLDAFGGGLISQSLLAYWFYVRFHANLSQLGVLFSLTSIVTAISILLTTPIARRIGNLNTMVITHLISNAFLISIAFAPSFLYAVVLLISRQTTSQMDVPTRQAFMADLFPPGDLLAANGITNSARMISTIPGGPIVGLLLTFGLIAVPIILAGTSKIIYDTSIYLSYRKYVKNPSENHSGFKDA